MKVKKLNLSNVNKTYVILIIIDSLLNLTKIETKERKTN